MNSTTWIAISALVILLWTPTMERVFKNKQTKRARAYQECIGQYPNNVSCDSCYQVIFGKQDVSEKVW